MGLTNKQKLISKYKGNEFLKNSFTLISGTSISQLVTLLFYPILTRIYSPEHFGLFSIFMSIIPIIVILASGAFEQAIIITKSSKETINLISVTIYRSIIVLLMLGLISYILINNVDILFKYKYYNQWILIIVFTSFLTIIYNIFNEWSVLEKKFKMLSINKIYNSSFITIFKTLNSFISFLSNGLIFGELFGKIITSSICLKLFIRNNIKIVSITNYKSLNKTRKKFSNFPRIMAPDLLINTLSGSIHVFFISAYFSNSDLGYLSLSLSLLTLPVTVISSAIKDVFREKANNEFAKTGSCRKLYVKLFKPIFVIGSIGFTLLYFIVPFLYSFFLGNQWTQSGYYAQILIPLFFFNFISMSLGGVFVIVNNLKISLYWQIFGLIISFISLYYGCVILKDFKMTLILFVIAKSITYILYSLLSFKYSVKIAQN